VLEAVRRSVGTKMPLALTAEQSANLHLMYEVLFSPAHRETFQTHQRGLVMAFDHRKRTDGGEAHKAVMEDLQQRSGLGRTQVVTALCIGREPVAEIMDAVAPEFCGEVSVNAIDTLIRRRLVHGPLRKKAGK
jgi:hypothetical protein